MNTFDEWYDSIGSPETLLLIEEWDAAINTAEVAASGALKQAELRLAEMRATDAVSVCDEDANQTGVCRVSLAPTSDPDKRFSV